MTRNNNNKLRAAFFAALMVLWVFSGAVAFGGSAAAQSADEDVDDQWASSERKWQGQSLVFYPNASDAEDANGQDYALYAHEGDATEGPTQGISELNFQGGDTPYAIIDTSDLEGNYVITNGGSRFTNIVPANESGHEIDNASDMQSERKNAAVDIWVQDLNTSFDEDTVNLGDDATVEVESNRNNYNLSVTSDDLSQTELYETFNAPDNGDVVVNTSEDDDDAVVLSNVGAGAEILANFDDSNFDEGDEPSFDFEVADTTASDSASVSVGDSVGQDAQFDQSIFTEERGDIATISLSTEQVPDGDSINVSITDGDDVISNLIVEPDDDDEIEFDVNTYNLTRTNDTEDVFEAQGDTYINHTDNGTFTNELANERVIDAGSYDLVASETNVGDESEEYAISTLELTERSTDSMTIYTAPNRAHGDINNLDSINEMIEDGQVSESSEIAVADTSGERTDERSDTVIFEIGVSGIYGTLGDDELENSNLSLTLAQQNPGPNEDPVTEDFSTPDNYTFISDEENNTLYVATRAGRFGDTDQAFDAEFNVSHEYLSAFSRDDVDDDESVSGELSLVDREAEFDTSNGEVVVEPVQDSTITGDTTVAPGTELRVRARASSGGDQSFLKTAEAVVQDDGTFEAVFSDQDSFEDVESGTEFTASIRSQSFEDNAETDGQVGQAEQASVSLSDVNAEEGDEVSSITVDSVDVPRGGFVAIHDSSLEDGAAFDSYLGSSEYLSEGESADVEVDLDEPLTEDTDIYAVVYEDTNGNEEFDFVDSEGDEDSDYQDEDGNSVSDGASVTFSDDTNNGTETPTGTEGPDDEDTETGDDGGDGEDQAGFGAVIALIALLGAALLAARRNDF